MAIAGRRCILETQVALSDWAKRDNLDPDRGGRATADLSAARTAKAAYLRALVVSARRRRLTVSLECRECLNFRPFQRVQLT